MNKHVATALWMFASLLMCHATSQGGIGDEILANPGFEGTYSQAGMAPNWGNGSWGNISVVFSDSTADLHSGSHAQKIVCTQPDPNAAVGWMQLSSGNVPIWNGHAYRYSIWLKGDNLSNNQVILHIRQGPAPYQTYMDKYVYVTNIWTQYQFEQQSPTTNGNAYFFIAMTGTGTLYADDASFQEIIPTPDTWIPTIPGARVTEADFGMHRHFRYSNGQWDYRWPTEPHGMFRFWDTYTGWKNIEPAKGVWDWTTLDTYLAAALQANPRMQFIYTFGVTPQWAAKYPDQPGAYGPGTASEPADMQDWIDYVTAVANHCKGKIKYYEIWNEPYISSFWGGTPNKLVELGQAAYTALKAVDPDIQVISPPCPARYVDSYFHAGGTSCTDIVASHFYPPTYQVGTPEKSAGDIQAVRRVMYYHGVDKPLWDTEGGFELENTQYPVGTPYPGTSIYPMPNAEAYKQIIRWYIINRTEGAGMTAFYSWDGGRFGMVDYPTADIKKKCGPALGQAYDWLIDRIITSRQVADDGTWTVGLNRGGTSGDDVIAWNPNGAATLDISTMQMKTAIDVFGNVTDISAAPTLAISDSPIYLAHSPSYLHGEEPRLYLPMNDLQYGFTSDMSGFDTHGQVLNLLPPNAGLVGGAMDFNGAAGQTQNINFANDPSLKITGEMSVSAWVYARSGPTGEGRTAASTYYWATTGQKGWNLGAIWTGTSFNFTVCSPTGIACTVGDSSFFTTKLNQWHHVVGVFKPSTYIRLYVDGVLVQEQTTNIPAAIGYHDSYGLVIGERSAFGQSAWDGYIDEFRLYPYTLCDREIQRLYQSGHRVAYLKLNTIAGGATPDYSLFNHANVVNNVALSDQSINDKAAEFSGAAGQTQNINFANDPTLKITGEMSVSAWVYARSGPTGEGRTVAGTYYWATTGQKGWNLGAIWTGTSFNFTVCSGGNAYTVGDSSFFTTKLNQWHHVVGVFKPSTYIRFYLDGVLVQEQTTNVPASIEHHDSYGLVIGERSAFGQSAWDGYIDEFEMCNRALTAEEITRLYETFH
ncbi:MAG: LamG-like jellyroll fold domain-containing protein [Phycisphaerales bacterium]